MNLQSLLYRFRWLHAPAGVLMLLLQKTPVLRLVTSGSVNFGIQSGDVLKSAFALGALGAYNSVAGATTTKWQAAFTTPTTITPPSGVATLDYPGVLFTAIGQKDVPFEVSVRKDGSHSVQRHKVTGTLPSGVKAFNLLNSVYTEATANLDGSLITLGARIAFKGIPTQAGRFIVDVKGDETNGTYPVYFRLTIDVNGPPIFTTQPAARTLFIGANVTFTTAVTGWPTPTLQWYKDGVALSGQTGATLTLSNVQSANTGSYTVTAFNAIAPSGVSSNAASLTVNAVPVGYPIFTTQPVAQTVNDGTNVTFTSVVTGTPTPTFQWYKDSVAISGQNAATLTLTNVQSANAGSYTLTASNSVEPSGVSSNAVNLTVNFPPIISTQPTNQSAPTGATATFSVVATGTPAPSYQWKKNGVDIAGAVSASYTTPNTISGDNGSVFTVVVSNSRGNVTSSNATLTVSVILPRLGWIATASGGGSPSNAIDSNSTTRWDTGAYQVPGQWFQVDMISPQTFSQIILDSSGSAADGPASYQVYVSNNGTSWGSAIASGTGSAVTTISFATENARYIRVVQTGTKSVNYWSIHEYNVYGPPNSAPVITTQPTNQTVTAGATVTFSVVATGTPAPTLQWFKDSVAISGQTSATLTLSNVQAANAGSYTLTAYNAAATGGVSSNTATLTVNPVPTAIEDWITRLNIPAGSAGKGQDPDGDGLVNLGEFAFNSSPLDSDHERIVLRQATVAGQLCSVITVPVRTGAVFSGTTSRVSAAIDQIIYTVEGSSDLTTWTLVLTEVTGAEATTLHSGLTPLESGWSYRSFCTPSGLAKCFLRTRVVEVPAP